MKKALFLIFILCLAILPLPSCGEAEIDNAEIIPIYAGMSAGKTANIKEVNLTRASVGFVAYAEEIYADYTATVGDTIYITVHIDNPSEYEIISLKLNGVKYVGNYQQFEPGTNAENLIIKLNVGEIPQTLTFVVSDIKWINGTTIEERDVGMSAMATDDSITVLVEPIPPMAPTLNYTAYPFFHTGFSNIEGFQCEYISVSAIRNGVETIYDIENVVIGEYGSVRWDDEPVFGNSSATVVWRYFYNNAWVTVTTEI
jgi:hypothetical protein